MDNRRALLSRLGAMVASAPLVLVLLLAGCRGDISEDKATIVEVTKKQYGFLRKKTFHSTLLEFPDGTRRTVSDDLGSEGDTITVYLVKGDWEYPDGYYLSKPDGF